MNAESIPFFIQFSQTFGETFQRDGRMMGVEVQEMADTNLTALEEALKPLARIADEYDINGLEEARPDWVSSGVQDFNLDVELLCGRGGKTLLTLRHAMQARLILTGKAYSQIDSSDVDEAKRVFEALYIGGMTWESLSQKNREDYIRKVKALKK